MSSDRVIVRRPMWVAWYPARRLRCNFRLERGLRRVRPSVLPGRWLLWIGLGPFYASLGPGIPEP